MIYKKHILLVAGIHGDEYEVIASITKYLKVYTEKLTPFLYIPQVSPSAVKYKTRNNINNIDLNRSFLNNTKDSEILAFRKRLKGFSFSAAFSFHEDSDRKNEFYMYCSHELNKKIFSHFETKLHSINMNFYNGIDDPTDPVLNNYINNGLLVSPVKKEKKGTLWPWLFENDHIEHFIDFEIPGKAPQHKKDKLVRIIFDCIISYYPSLFL